MQTTEFQESRAKTRFDWFCHRPTASSPHQLTRHPAGTSNMRKYEISRIVQHTKWNPKMQLKHSNRDLKPAEPLLNRSGMDQIELICLESVSCFYFVCLEQIWTVVEFNEVVIRFGELRSAGCDFRIWRWLIVIEARGYHGFSAGRGVDPAGNAPEVGAARRSSAENEEQFKHRIKSRVEVQYGSSTYQVQSTRAVFKCRCINKCSDQVQVTSLCAIINSSYESD
ncbi:pentatricopeptide repeat-containing protein [Dorcoceras hygrometricum]|uniref:Pentatricopeptide repeat-containing protein n=1 Tax=Dorcoceras hygrometricum TaxID=472368 RepID=A0A2Z7AGN4_9LAMI|nr:pentatricopeptide repeat-containing protein [Dorcoceras hygrometricum]